MAKNIRLLNNSNLDKTLEIEYFSSDFLIRTNLISKAKITMHSGQLTLKSPSDAIYAQISLYLITSVQTRSYSLTRRNIEDKLIIINLT